VRDDVRNAMVWLVWPERSPAASPTSPESSPASAVDDGRGPRVSAGLFLWLFGWATGGPKPRL
jgi:hypothetical protein